MRTLRFLVLPKPLPRLHCFLKKLDSPLLILARPLYTALPFYPPLSPHTFLYPVFAYHHCSYSRSGVKHPPYDSQSATSTLARPPLLGPLFSVMSDAAFAVWRRHLQMTIHVLRRHCKAFSCVSRWPPSLYAAPPSLK